jgi:hypothetical protein
MLITLPKLTTKDKAKGITSPQPIKLIPELCLLTGPVLLRGLEKDFTMKKELDSITKLSPDRRYGNLRKLLDTIKNQPAARKEL